MLERESLENALGLLGALLQEQGTAAQLVVVGGSNLLLLGVLDRPTADVDVVALRSDDAYVRADVLPASLVDAVADVGATLGLGPRWLNTGPVSLMDFGLPSGWTTRVVVRRYGSLQLHLLGRADLVALKLYAAVDQGPGSKHFHDLHLLDPTPAQLLEGARWTRTHEPSAGFEQELRRVLALLGTEVGDGDL